MMMLQSLLFWNPAVLTCCFMGLVTLMPQGVKKPKAKAKRGTRRATGKQKPKSGTKTGGDSDDDAAFDAHERVLKSNNMFVFVL